VSANGQGQANHGSPAASMVDHALIYAEQGLMIFPCDPHSKKPLTTNGFKNASRDPQQVREWWAAYPQAMIGAPTGACNGFWVLDVDVDPAENVNGLDTLNRLIARFGELPPTRASITPRGGFHLFWRWAPGLTLRNSASKVGPGLDVRAEGGYVILPPSTCGNGASYRWAHVGNEPVVSALNWLVALVSPQKASTDRAKPARKNPERDRAWAQAAVEEECKLVAAAPYHQRNTTLNKAAFSLFQIIAVILDC
jgi:putative DNA primase/helicase